MYLWTQLRRMKEKISESFFKIFTDNLIRFRFYQAEIPLVTHSDFELSSLQLFNALVLNATYANMVINL